MSSVESYQFQTLPNKMTNFLFLCFITTGQSVLQQFDMVQRARNPEMMGLGKVDIWEPTNMQHVSTTPATVQLLRALLSYDQRKRPNATAALRSSIFDECRATEQKEMQEQQVIQQALLLKQQEEAKNVTQMQDGGEARVGGSEGTVTGTGTATGTGTGTATTTATTTTTTTTTTTNSTQQHGKENVLTTPTRSKRVNQLLKEAGCYETPPPSTDNVEGSNSGSSGGSGPSGSPTSNRDRLRTNSEHVLRQAFRKYDNGNTGYIDAKAVSKILVKLGDFSQDDEGTMNEGDTTMSLMAAEAEVALADTSATGVLNYEDFKEWFTERAATNSENNKDVPGVDAAVTSARVAAARQLLMQSWDSPPRSTSPNRKKPPSKLSIRSSPKAEDNKKLGVGSPSTLPESPKRSLFNRFDEEKNGCLNQRQFGQMMKHLGMVTNPDTEDDLLVEAEMAMLADVDGKIPYQDWRNWYSEQ